MKATGIFVAGFIIAAGGAATILAKDAQLTRQDLETAITLVPLMSSQVESDEVAAAHATFNTLEELTSSARGRTNSPLWKAASFVPSFGDNFRAITEVAVSADEIVSGAVWPLLLSADSLDWRLLSPKNGKIDLQELERVAPAVLNATNTVRLSHERLKALDTESLIPYVADAVTAATEQLGSFRYGLDSAAYAFQVLPGMLGGDTPRRYLLLIQNNAESRATGGIPGAVAVLTADDGHIEFESQTSAASLGSFRPPIAVDPVQELLFTQRIGTHMQNVNLTPDFPTAARTAKTMWEDRHQQQSIDGVIALDPIVLGHILAATGPIPLETSLSPVIAVSAEGLPRSLTSENVVRTLLADVYREIESPQEQDNYFAAVAKSIFTATIEGGADGTKLIGAFRASAAEGRLLLWSDDSTEQSVITSAGLSGAVTGTAAGGTLFGVYFNDGTGAKMDLYANRTVQLQKKCNVGGYGQYSVRVSLQNSAPADAASTLPEYVTGRGAYGITPGHIRTNYVFYGPAQSRIESITIDGESLPFSSGIHGQRPVGTVTAELAPGDSAVLEVNFSRVVQTSEPRVQVTPTTAGHDKALLPFVADTDCN